MSAALTATLDLGPAVALSCRECGKQYPLGPSYACVECFGPLEVSYDFTGVTRASIEAGPRNLWRYNQLLPVPTGICCRYQRHVLPVITGNWRRGISCRGSSCRS